jgi:hypothetical protein
MLTVPAWLRSSAVLMSSSEASEMPVAIALRMPVSKMVSAMATSQPKNDAPRLRPPYASLRRCSVAGSVAE